MNFDDNRVLAALFGDHDRNLARIEKELDVEISSRGNRVLITGDSWAQQAAQAALTTLYALVVKGDTLVDGEVTGAIRMAQASVSGQAQDPASLTSAAQVIRTRRRTVTPRSATQAEYVSQMRANDMVFGIGPRRHRENVFGGCAGGVDVDRRPGRAHRPVTAGGGSR